MGTLTLVSTGLWWWVWWEWLAGPGSGWFVMLFGTVAVIGLGIWITYLMMSWAGRKRSGAGAQ